MAPPPLLTVLSCCLCLLHAAGHGLSAVTPPPPSRPPCTDNKRPPVVLPNVSDADTAVIAKERLCARCRPDERFVATPPGSTSRAAPPCVEKIDDGSYFYVDGHRDGSPRIFLSTRDGKILLAAVPPRGSGRALSVNGGGAGPFLDLAGRLHYDAAKGLGLMGVAFHSRFPTTGRFFVSYTTCDSNSSPSSTAAAPGAPSAYKLIVDEFSAKGRSGSADLSKADPSPVRRVFTMAFPNTSVNRPGGQILFQPAGGDRYLYLIAGHGGDGDLHGKIIRLDVDGSPPPLMHRPETLNGSLNDPRGCSFDSKRPSDLYCANIEQQYEQVYLISNKPGASPPSLVVDHGRTANGSAPSIVGGFVYRGTANPTLSGKYLYMYGSAAWTAALEAPPASSGRQPSAQLLPNIRCSGSTPLPCRGSLVGGRVLALGEDNSKDALLLATDGVYRVVQPKLCGGAPPPPPRSKPWLAWLLSAGTCALALAFYQIYLTVFAGGDGGGGGGGRPAASCCCASVECYCNNTVINNNGPDVRA